MKSRLAIDGGSKVITKTLEGRVPHWPPVYPAVPRHLKDIYTSRRWSFNETYEKKLCKAFAEYHDADHGVYMVNGTVTLECLLAALGVGPGDEVIVPALTWLATAMAAVYLGATPVFVDIEPDTWCLDPAKVKKAITRKTKAIIPVHLYGSMADLEALGDISRKHGLPVIEDCAHAHGGTWAGKGVGSHGVAGSFSFQQSKTLPSGEGGMCITGDAELAARLYRLKHIGYDFHSGQGKAGSSPPTDLICHNYRGTEFEAAILLESLKHLKAQTRQRDKNAKALARALADVPGVRIQSRGRRADLQGYYCLGLRFDLAQFNRVTHTRLAEVFAAEGLALGQTYGPVYDHMLWNVSPGRYRKADGCSVAEAVCKSSLVLFHNWLLADTAVIESIGNAIRKVWDHRNEVR